MHGGWDRNDGTDIGGEYVYIYNNTFLGLRPPYTIRGITTADRTFYNNAIYGYRSQYFTNLYDYQGSRVPRLIVGKNLWGISGTPE
jgi:hypothetical protein